MQNRKQRNLEIERQKKNRRRLSAVITTFVITLILLAIVWITWDVRNRGWLMTFEGQRIATADLRFLANIWQENISVPETRDAIINHLVQTQAILYHAEQAGLRMSDEEREMLRGFIDSNREAGAIPRAVSDERALELVGAMDFIVPLVFDHFVNYEPDPAEFEQEFAVYLEANREEYALRSTEAQLILTDNRQALEEIRQLANAADEINFEEYARLHCVLYDHEQDTAFTAAITDIVEWFDLLIYSPELLRLEVGQVSSVIELAEDEYLLIYMKERPEIEDSAIEEMYRERIITERRAEIFQELLEEWVENADYTINQRAVDSL
jgi:hypothetical protein